MWQLAIGKVVAVMTADAVFHRMKAITASIVKTTTVTIAAPIARNAIPRFVLAVRMSALIAVNRCATDVQHYARNAKEDFVKIV
jgi:predicted house-cleaning NTP pyrophosphatase (Maf/HAM1 superfamily)